MGNKEPFHIHMALHLFASSFSLSPVSSLHLSWSPIRYFFEDANISADSFPFYFFSNSQYLFLLSLLFVCSAAVTIISPSPLHYLSLFLLDYHLFSVLLHSNSYRLRFSLPPNCTHSQLSAPTHHHHHHPNPLPPSHLFPWPWSMLVNASTLLPIISITHLSDCPPPWLLLPFVLQTGLSHCLFYSGQNPTSLNWQRDSWSVYCLSPHMCLCCLFEY